MNFKQKHVHGHPILTKDKAEYSVRKSCKNCMGVNDSSPGSDVNTVFETYSQKELVESEKATALFTIIQEVMLTLCRKFKQIKLEKGSITVFMDGETVFTYYIVSRHCSRVSNSNIEVTRCCGVWNAPLHGESQHIAMQWFLSL